MTLARGQDGWQVQKSAGGLVTAMDPILKRTNGIWVGWPGDSTGEGDPQRQTAIDDAVEGQRFLIVDIPPNTAKLFYEGYSNQTVWPLFHYFPSLLRYNDKGWAAYVDANRRFHDAVMEHLRPDDLVWVHDYQLMLLPQMLRESAPDARIGFFLHIPFPSSELFRLVPGRDELLQGLLGSDLIAFQTHSHLQHFRSALLRITGVDSRISQVEIGGRAIRLEALPIGIAADEFRNLTDEDDEAGRFLNKYLQRFQGKRILLAVDRLDYTKGIPERLRTFRHLLRRAPRLRGKVVLIQVAVPSREQVSSYARLQRRVNELVGEINGQFATPDWTPVVYLRRGISRAQLVALYKLADVGWVSPLRDGMNLVAKEYVASNRGDGVLVLSELAGAAAEMGEALLVNPFDEERTADVVRRALEMPVEERRERMDALRERVTRNNVFAWGERFVSSLKEAAQRRSERPSGQPATLEMRAITEAFGAARRRLVFLNYDGTLAGYTARPEQAAPSQEVVELLKMLTAQPGTDVAIISGRHRDNLQKWFGDNPRLWLAAELGALLRCPGEHAWKVTHPALSGDWKARVLPVLEQFVERTPGSLIEEKEYSVVWHYRMSHEEFGDWMAGELLGVLEGMLGDVQVSAVLGQKCVTLKPLWISKGQIVRDLLRRVPDADFHLAVGDDRSDEDMFAELGENAWTVRVGLGDTGARAYLPGPEHLLFLLRQFVRFAEEKVQRQPASS